MGGEVLQVNSSKDGIEFGSISTPEGLRRYTGTSSNTGWCLIGQTPADIGGNAIDFTADGSATTGAIGDNSVAFGSAKVTGDNSFAFGSNLNVNEDNQVVFGWYNDDSSTAQFVVGNGVSGTPANSFEVFSDGKVVAEGLTISNIVDSKSLVTKEYVQNLTSSGKNIKDIDVTTNGETDFDIITSGTLTAVSVWLNGVKLRESTISDTYDYHLSANEQSVIFEIGAQSGDWVQVEYLIM